MFSLILVGGLAMALASSATPPDFTGHWQIDAAKSKAGAEQTVSLDLKQQGDAITFTRVFEDEHRKQATSHFTCSLGQKKCDFDENGHKASVSLWYNGPELVVLKTNGDKHDSTVEWHLSLSTDGKTLSVNREVIEPTDTTEKLVFSKTESL